MPSTLRSEFTTGIEPPLPIRIAGLPYSSVSAV